MGYLSYRVGLRILWYYKVAQFESWKQLVLVVLVLCLQLNSS